MQIGGPAYTQAVHAFARTMTLAAKTAAMQQDKGNRVLDLYLNGTSEALAALQVSAQPLCGSMCCSRCCVQWRVYEITWTRPMFHVCALRPDAGVQAQAEAMPPEPLTVPGDPPGIFACDYLKLTQILAGLAAGRVHVLQGNLQAAAVRAVSCLRCRVLPARCYLLGAAAKAVVLTLHFPGLVNSLQGIISSVCWRRVCCARRPASTRGWATWSRRGSSSRSSTAWAGSCCSCSGLRRPRRCAAARLHLAGCTAAACNISTCTQAFQQDLDVHPDNGWALLGQAQAAELAGDAGAAAGLRQRHEAAWQHADAPLASPCLMFSQAFTGHKSASALLRP